MPDPHDAREALARLIWRTSDMDREDAAIVADAVLAAGWLPPVDAPPVAASPVAAALAERDAVIAEAREALALAQRYLGGNNPYHQSDGVQNAAARRKVHAALARIDALKGGK